MGGRTGYEVDGVRMARARMALNSSGQPIGPDDRPMTQAELGALIGRDRVTVNKIEAGAARCSLETLERIASVTGRSREWLLGEPERVDDFELARDRMASAMAKIADGFEDFTAAVATLEQRAREAAREAAGDEVKA